MWPFILYMLCLVSPAYCLDTNVIRLPKEFIDSRQLSLQTSEVQAHRETVDVNVQNAMGRPSGRRAAVSQADEWSVPKKAEHNANNSRQLPQQSRNKQKVPEMAPCVRSSDCEEGLCCARYLTGKRCQRVPAQGETCLLRGRSKSRRNLERCDCTAGLTCRSQPESPRGQGTCQPKRQKSRRTARQSRKSSAAQKPCQRRVQ